VRNERSETRRNKIYSRKRKRKRKRRKEKKEEMYNLLYMSIHKERTWVNSQCGNIGQPIESNVATKLFLLYTCDCSVHLVKRYLFCVFSKTQCTEILFVLPQNNNTQE
jgi:hypothetical protein